MKKFSLIDQLNSKDDHDTLNQPTQLPNGIKYQQYDIEVGNTVQTINIPLRESSNFETYCDEINSDFDNETIKKMLRKFRGIRG